VSWIGSWTLEIPADHRLKFLECVGLDVELPFEVGAHFSLHLVDLLEGKHAPTDDAPGLVRVCIVADDLGSNHEGGDEEAVPRGTACGNKPRLQSLQQIESSKGHGGHQPRAMESIRDEVGERRGWGRSE